jgi:DNA-binding cell septation regulator SpoVG
MGLSVHPEAIRARIRRLPALMELWADAARKKDALAVIKEFQDSIENGKIRPPLAPRTIARKKKLGMTKPDNPLRGFGMEKARTYARSLRLYKITNGWRVKMPAIPHHSSTLKMDALFQIHELGKVIKTKTGSIVIPSRPALARAYQKVLQNISKGEIKEVQEACAEFLRTGKTHKGDDILATAAALERTYGSAD